MKTFKFTAPALLLGLALAAPAFAGSETYNIDTAASKLAWKGSKVVGGSHNGTVELKSGSVTFVDGVATKGQVVADMATIKDLDLEDAKWNGKLVGHLKSDDFFGVDKHPEAKLVLTSFKKTKAGYDLAGKLTIKGVTKDVTLSGKETVSGKSRTIVADLKFDRTLFNVRYGSGKFFDDLGDKMISDEIEIQATIKLQDKAVKTAAN